MLPINESHLKMSYNELLPSKTSSNAYHLQQAKLI